MRLRDPGLGPEISANHRRLDALCDQLERVADRLPGAIDRQECLVLARALKPALVEVQDFEESRVFPVLLTWAPLHGDVADAVERLRIEHQLDGCYAEEIQDMLRSYGEGRPELSPDAAGFMLRGFFESLRRHVAFERHILVPLLTLASQRANA